MDSFNKDILLHISKFLDNNTCCKLSDLHNLSIINKFYYSMYKEKVNIIPSIPLKHCKLIYNTEPKTFNYNCYMCGPFNKIEVSNIIEAIENSRNRSLPDRPKLYYPQNPQFPIHFTSTYDMNIFKTKVSTLALNLKFLLSGRCCNGQGSTLFIKH